MLAIAGYNATCTAASAINPAEFKAPQERQLSCYWYWISDNVTEQGVINDLKSMKEQGINRAFIGHQGVDNVPRGDVPFFSEKWWSILHTALKTASELGIEIGLFNGPGWSHMGGPWVKPEQSMRYLASQRVDITGKGKTAEVEFLKPDNFLSNVRVLAFPRKFGEHSVASGEVDVSQKKVIELSADEPMTLRSVKVYNAGPLIANVTVRVKDGNRWRDLKNFLIHRPNMTFHTGYDMTSPVAEGIADVAGSEFQVEFSNVQGNGRIPGVELSDEPVVTRYLEKILARMHETPAPQWTEYKWDTEHNYTTDEVVAQTDIIDLTSLLTEDHKLKWQVPAGNWTIIRTYMAPTNIVCDPTFEGSGRGPEVDRWNHDALKAHYDAYMGEVMRRIPPEDRSTWKVVVCDSYEMATQNFGDDFFEYFTKRFGYDPTPFLLTYSGIVVGSNELSDRFLWDLRRMIADRLTFDNIGQMERLAQRDGKHVWLETYGHWGFPGEFLQYGSQAGEVAGEFWTTGTLGDIENRAASSVGHIYGKDKVSAESFTYGGKEFMFCPRDMKARGDYFFTEGINNTLLHLYVSQTSEDEVPGMIPWFSTEFNRKNTWYGHLHLFGDYLKRCNYLLQQGTYLADVAYFIGDDTPVMTGITEPKMPRGRQFDYINADVLINNATVNDRHEITLPYGNRYRLLVLPPCKTYRPETLAAIKRLVEQGAVVLTAGEKPAKSPSLQNYPQCDAQVAAMADELWGYSTDGTFTRRVGNGYFLKGMSINEAIGTRLLLGQTDNGADFTALKDGAPIESDDILYCHYTSEAQDIYFISNQSDAEQTFTASLREMAGRQPQLWDPVTGDIRLLPDFSASGNDCRIPLRLAPHGSTFIVLGHDAAAATVKKASNYPQYKEIGAVSESWNVAFRSNYGDNKDITMDRLTDWTELTDPDLKYFSGHGIYTSSFKAKKLPKGKRIVLDLGQVDNICTVSINGTSVGGAWTTPYVIDITDAVRKGNNSIEIDVANNFMNREIGDLVYPDNKKLNITRILHKATDALQPSGLKGPVRILSEE